jgi:hypothetical protein
MENQTTTVETTTTRQPVITNVAQGSYLNCKKRSFKFADARKKFFALLERKAAQIKEMGGIPSGTKKVLALLAIGVCIGLACIEAFNTQSTVAATTGLSDTFALIVGFLFSSLGMLAGEMLSDVKKDPFTGSWKLTPKWFLALFLTALYLYGQYFLASSAEKAAPADMQDTAHNLTFYILGIAVIEVLFGILFLKTAFHVLTLIAANIKIRLTVLRMNRTSRHTEEWWQRHIYEVQDHNLAHNTNAPHGIESDSIRDARDYYNLGGHIDALHYSQEQTHEQ